MKDLFEEPWIKAWIADPVVSDKTALVVTDALVSFRKAGILQTGVLSFLTNLLATEEEMEELGDMFKQMDTSKDGFLSIAELREGLQKQLDGFKYKDTDWDEILVSIDSNGDGQVDFAEFVSAAYNRQKLISKKNLDIAFKIFDRDGDGQITKEEMKAVFSGGASKSELIQKFEQVWSEIMAEVDQNGDGQISYDEFSEAMTKVLLQRSTWLKQSNK